MSIITVQLPSNDLKLTCSRTILIEPNVTPEAEHEPQAFVNCIRAPLGNSSPNSDLLQKQMEVREKVRADWRRESEKFRQDCLDRY